MRLQELEESSRIMGYAAVKYADLKNQRLTNYKFSFDDMLSLKGNTAVYLLYAHARIAGIVRKSNKDVDSEAPMRIFLPPAHRYFIRQYRPLSLARNLP